MVPIKTKTIVKTLRSMGLIPSFNGDLNNDVLPEAILIRNIIDDSLANMILLRDLFQIDVDCIPALDSSLRNKIKDLQECSEQVLKEDLVNQLDQYDADTDDSYETRSLRRRRRTKSLTKWRTTQQKETASESFVTKAKDILLHCQNDRRLLMCLKDALPSKEPNEFIQLFEKFHNFAVDRIMTPYGTHVQEVESLMASIHLIAKFEKQVDKLKKDVMEIQRQKNLKMKEVNDERSLLEEELETIRNHSQEIIANHKEQVHNRLKVLAWHSHGRQSKTLDHILDLKKELEECLNEHVLAEAEMRKTNAKLEKEVKDIIDKYDHEMFKKHETIDSITKEYQVETENLNELLTVLDEVESQQHELMEQNRIEDETRRLLELMNIRRIVAAKTIQRAYRSYKTRMMLKKKKRKKKSAAKK